MYVQGGCRTCASYAMLVLLSVCQQAQPIFAASNRPTLYGCAHAGQDEDFSALEDLQASGMDTPIVEWLLTHDLHANSLQPAYLRQLRRLEGSANVARAPTLHARVAYMRKAANDLHVLAMRRSRDPLGAPPAVLTIASVASCAMAALVVQHIAFRCLYLAFALTTLAALLEECLVAFICTVASRDNVVAAAAH